MVTFPPLLRWHLFDQPYKLRSCQVLIPSTFNHFNDLYLLLLAVLGLADLLATRRNHDSTTRPQTLHFPHLN
ncbi:hypothetical protein K491DRAFT_402664 [Lophiostoma macrostomum CBS 122681]|uniref:Uncharacterized protein n=1 Tax=Lophiostoma macrostomum CBS 122681 TaxID=1314788 RepID=A0A6A6SGU4_9PLEO|nr:hypothetical protein K491DRAFT_402664 [Lophiostoma macrostomum CBS 122681]